MKCIILAAGYATRLYPLTENFPKPLLMVGEHTILDWIIEDLETNSNITEYVVVSNHKFIEHFLKWGQTHKYTDKIKILDDGSMCNEDRLGAVKDIEFAIENANIDDDILVLAGDNLLDFSLKSFVDFFYEKDASVIMRYYEPALEKLQRTGVVVIDDEAKVLDMEEKPKQPKSNWAVPPFYAYKREDISCIKQGIEDGCPVDAPGNFLAWFSKHRPIYAYEMPGKRYDIGNMQSYEAVKAEYKGITI